MDSTNSATAVTLRPLAASDSLFALTALLHRAYAHVAATGLNFTAVDQSVETTQRRVASGHCIVAEVEGQIVGTVTVCEAYDPNRDPWARMTPWFYRHDVAHLHQLAVDPPLQGRGLGGQLIDAAEQWAREGGRAVMVLDTAVPATHSRRRYVRLGYRDVDEVQWAGKHYRSILMAKALADHLPDTTDAEHRCAQVRALWAHLQARDWAAMQAALAPDAVMTWPCSNERLLDADAIVRVNAIRPETWTVHVREVAALADGRVHSVVEVWHDGQRFFANSTYHFTGTQIAQVEEYWASVLPPPAWRNAAAIGAYERMEVPA